VNTQWRLVAFGSAGAETPALPQPPVTLQFGADGRFGGNSGCNLYGGSYQVQGTSLALSDIASTLRACLDDRITQQEGHYLGALRLVRQYSLVGTRLTLSSPDGATVLTFAPHS
jgi:heat shock protein HslJ